MFIVKNVIHIFGASGSGTTTLGEKICRELGYTQIDTDKYFWIPTDPPFKRKRPKEERVEMMIKAVEKAENAVISGSITDWGEKLIPFFTLAVRLEMEQSIRIDRLIKREKEKYGLRIEPGGDMHRQHMEFLEWAKAYDRGGTDIRSKALHDEMQKSFPCRVLCLDGADDLEENFNKVREIIEAKK